MWRCNMWPLKFTFQGKETSLKIQVSGTSRRETEWLEILKSHWIKLIPCCVKFLIPHEYQFSCLHSSCRVKNEIVSCRPIINLKQKLSNNFNKKQKRSISSSWSLYREGGSAIAIFRALFGVKCSAVSITIWVPLIHPTFLSSNPIIRPASDGTFSCLYTWWRSFGLKGQLK